MPAATVVDSKPRTLRILHYLPGIRLEQGGVVRAVLDWCKVFAARGHQMTLATYQGNDIPPEWRGRHGKPGLPEAFVVPAPASPVKLLGRVAMQTLAEAVDRSDVVHLHGPWLDGNRQIASLARKRNVPYLVSAHGMLNDWSMTQRALKKRIYMKLTGRRFLNGAACIHCTAAGELAQASRWFDNPSTAVIPYLVDLQPFENLPGTELGLALLPPDRRSEPKLLFLSRLHEKKGVDVLIRAMGILRDRNQSGLLMIAGTGEPQYEQFLRSLTTQLNLSDRVFFLGLVTGTAKISLYQAADVFVLPTFQENFGLVLTESMSCGTPVVTTKGTDIWQEVERAGGLIADINPGAVADAIMKMLGNPADRIDRGHRGRQWVFENLAVDSLSRKYEQLYAELADARL